MKFLVLPLALALFMPALAYAEVAVKPTAPQDPPTAQVTAQVGQPAPDFTGTDSNGTAHKLSDFKGKTVVLEWTNPGCPFVMKHYDSNNMQGVQKAAIADGVIWLSINSSAEDKEGYQTPAEANAYMKEKGSAPTARILDPKGDIGHLYGAQTTPHMYVIDKDGTLVYAGAIDSDNSFKPESIKGATNYVTAALADIKAGKPVAVASTKAYGCGVKYAN